MTFIETFDDQTWHVSAPLSGSITDILTRSCIDNINETEVCRGGACKHDLVIRTSRGAVKFCGLDSYTVFVVKKYLGAVFRSTTFAHLEVHRDSCTSGSMCSDRLRFAEQACRYVEKLYGFPVRPETNEEDELLKESIRQSRPWFGSIITTMMNFRQDHYGPAPKFEEVQKEIIGWGESPPMAAVVSNESPPITTVAVVVEKRKRNQTDRYKPHKSSRAPKASISKH